jgi:hypothetical protein
MRHVDVPSGFTPIFFRRGDNRREGMIPLHLVIRANGANAPRWIGKIFFISDDDSGAGLNPRKDASMKS